MGPSYGNGGVLNKCKRGIEGVLKEGNLTGYQRMQGEQWLSVLFEQRASI